MFCPKCGSLLLPEDGRMVCDCGFSEKPDNFKLGELAGKKAKITHKDSEKEIQILPETNCLCAKCGNRKAYYWFVQTRASDEPPTKFLRCTKCENTWRDYS